MKLLLLPKTTRKRTPFRSAFIIVWLLLVTMKIPAYGHFGMVLPSSNQITQEKQEIEVVMSFIHPFEKTGMDLEWPQQATLTTDGSSEDLKGIMSETAFLGNTAWKLNFKPKRPGIYWFAMEPTPYWEPAEDVFIVHYTKTAISAYGEDQGWDTPIGLKTEIVPLLRPFGNYAGNTFTGKVLVDNSPVTGAEVEVELFNTEGWVAPSDLHITQVIKTDENGNFSFTCPLPGWWGFSALTEADYTLKGPDGTDKQVELGAVIWVYFDPNPFLGN